MIPTRSVLSASARRVGHQSVVRAHPRDQRLPRRFAQSKAAHPPCADSRSRMCSTRTTPALGRSSGHRCHHNRRGRCPARTRQHLPRRRPIPATELRRRFFAWWRWVVLEPFQTPGAPTQCFDGPLGGKCRSVTTQCGDHQTSRFRPMCLW